VTTNPSRLPGVIQRCLAHRFFWPSYAVLVLLGLVTIQPWGRWATSATSDHSLSFGLRIHQKHLPIEADAGLGSILLASEALGSPGPKWLVCDGSRLLKSDYPALAQHLGNHFGEAGDDGFRLPDYRGLRCGIDSSLGGFGNVLTLWAHVAPTSSGSDPLAGTAFVEPEVVFWIKAK